MNPQERRTQINKVIDILGSEYLKGKRDVVKLAVISLLSGGHLLIEDIPGLGKTTLALALSGALGLSFGRVQSTSDLLPSDITGLSIYDREEKEFRFIKGPIFNNIILVDEINRAMPKTQSALLEAMEEERVTVEGTTMQLPNPFMVIATQNPLEQVGTYPLPESQLDRFLVTTGVGYPPADIEKEILRGGTMRHKISAMKPMLTLDEVVATKKAINDSVYLSEPVAGYIHNIMLASRKSSMTVAGISPRGGINIALAAKTVAFLDGRDHVLPEDVQEIIVPVGAHRLLLKAEHETLPKGDILAELVKGVAVPLA